MKAVVWSDTLQIGFMYGSLITVLVKGIFDVGGLDVVWERSSSSGRLEMLK